MNDKGWICLYRKIEDNPIVCKDNDYFRVWLHLLLNATHKEIDMIFDKKKITLKPGQLITGREEIAVKCKINSSKVYRILKSLEIGQQIEQQKSSKGTLISVLKYEEYQKYEQQIEQQVNSERTTNEQQTNTNNNITSKQDIYSSTTNTSKISERDGNKRNGDENLFEFVEKIFGRPLGSTETEKIMSWEDTKLTRYAVKQAELSRAFNVNYIETILNSYRKENIKTVTEAEERQKRFEANKINKYNSKNNRYQPEWLNKKIEEEPLSEKEQQELQELLKDFK